MDASAGANLTADMIDYISVYYNVEAILNLALVETLIDECVASSPGRQYIRHGMDLLPRAMANDLNSNAKIQYNSKVTEIDQSSYKIRVKIDCKV